MTTRGGLPQKPGVYLLKDRAGKIIYIGKAKNLRRRVASYFGRRAGSPEKVNLLAARVVFVDYIVCASESEALILEDRLVKKIRPFYNALLRDDKSYPSLRLSSSEKFPSLSAAHRKPGAAVDGGDYYGPYPNAPALKKLAVWLNKSFGLKMCARIPASEKEKRNCIYLQTGECAAPCVEPDAGGGYSGRVAALKKFLSGRYAEVRAELERDIKKYSQRLAFEKAAAARDMMRAIESMADSVRFNETDESVYDRAAGITEKLSALAQRLHLRKFPSKIDCADISNTGGAFAVGAVARFLLGEPDKNNYRRFRIKNLPRAGTQNDFAMMAEVVARRATRLAREAADNLPDLFVVDGGKGQLLAAAGALKTAGLAGGPDLIAIAKGTGRDEIFYDGGRSKTQAAEGDEVLDIIRRVRDEAHRFAVSYHRKLRDNLFRGGRKP